MIIVTQFSNKTLSIINVEKACYDGQFEHKYFHLEKKEVGIDFMYLKEDQNVLLVGYPNHRHSNHEVPSYIQVWDLKEKIKLLDKKMSA
jgi:hypothetical protein